METLNRLERQILRRIQQYEQAALLEQQVTLEQIGTVDVYVHPTNADPALTCVTPHKGVAWVRRQDLASAFGGLERLGREPRLVFQEALFPQAFQQQLALTGLELQADRHVLVYRPLYGPLPPDEVPFGALPEVFGPDVRAGLVSDAQGLSTWLRVFSAGAESLGATPTGAELADAIAGGDRLCALASYHGTPLGAARVGLRQDVAALEAVVTAPLWHDMGLEEALIAVSVREAQARGCDLIFTVQPAHAYALYYRLGFERITRLLTYCLPLPEPFGP